MVIDVEVPTYLLTSVAIAPLLVVTAFGVNFATEHIQAITHVKHGIAVDAVVAGIATPVGIHPTLVVALLAKEVVEVQCHNKAFVLEERLRYLAVPDEFVGIRRGVIETSPAILVQIGRELETHGLLQHQLFAIAEAPGVKIGTGLPLIA